MATIEDFKLRITVEGDGKLKAVKASVGDLKKDLEDFGQVGGPLGNTVNGIVGKLGPLGLAASAAAIAFAGLGMKALNLAGELSDISGATGIATGTLMNFRQSVVEAGGKADDFAQIAAKLNQSVQEAAGGNETLQKAFQRLGVFVTDSNGKIRGTEDILRNIVEQFRNGSISGEQYAAAVDILGKNINKLELSKLQAVADPIKDEQIKQLDKYNDAIDKMNEKFNNLAITIVGKVAIAFNSLATDIDKATEAHKKLDERLAESGKAQVMPGVTGFLRSILGLDPRDTEPLITRRLSEAEKAAAARKKYEQEMERLMAPYKTRAPSEPAPSGGFGATPEATIKAREASLGRIKNFEVEQARQTQLAANSERLSAILQFASQEEAITFKSAAALKDIEINTAAEVAKARLDIYNQERLTDAEKAREFTAKKLEIELKAATDTAKVRSQSVEQLTRELERIQSIITQSKARVEEEQNLNRVLQEKNRFQIENAAATDVERDRAQKLFDIEEERLKVLRQIALIKDLPPDERNRREAEINEIYSKRKVLTQEQQVADQEMMGNFTKGFEKAYRQYVEDSRNYFDQAGKLFGTLTQGMEDAIINFAKTGKFEFKNFLNVILEELLRSQVRQLIAQLFTGSGGGGGGGGLFGGKIIPGFLANGGPASANKPYIVGERGPELFVPNASGTVISNESMMGGSTMVTYNINAVDAQSFNAMIARDPSFIHAVAEKGRRSIPQTRR